MARLRICAAAAAGALLTGCAVGPNFTRPAPPTLNAYPDQGAPARIEGGGEAQTVELGRPTDPKWWRLFDSPSLDALVGQGLAASPTLASAREALSEAENQARAGAGVFFPSLGVSAAAADERFSPAQFGQSGAPHTSGLYTVSGSISYALDLFGGERRQVEALNAAAEYQRQAVGAAYILLTSNIVDTAIAHAGYEDEAQALTRIVKLDADARDIEKSEVAAGYAPLTAELAAEQQLDADRQTLAAAGQRLAATQTLMKTLLGLEAAAKAAPTPTLAELAVPPDAPASLPSQLVRQRPDILEAEATLHQASAQVGVATAAMFPSINLTGDYGADSVSLASLTGPAARFWDIGPSVSIPVFRGGALWFGRKAAWDAYRVAAANYRQTVLAALEQTADALKALSADAEQADASQTALDAAVLTSARLDEANRSAGLIADADEMTAQIVTERARLAAIAAKAQRLQDVVALYVASGAGWSGKPPGAAAAPASVP